MDFSAQKIAEIVKGKVEGNPEVCVNRFSKIESAEPGSLAFLDNIKYHPYLYSTKASIVLVNSDLELENPIPKDTTLVRTENSRMAFAALLDAYVQAKDNRKGISANSMIEEEAILGAHLFIGEGAVVGRFTKVGSNSKIYPGCLIGDNVRIGENCTLYPGVKIYDDCIIGDNVTLHAGCVIGSDGFGFEPNRNNEYKKVHHIGNVIIEDWVEIGANTTIDKGTMGSTIIRKGVKLDNLIQVAHNVEIGENTVIAAQTGIAGSTKIGKNCMIGGQVGIVGHLEIADEVKIAAQSGISHNIDQVGQIVQGSPAFEIGDYKRSYVLFRALPKLKGQLDQLIKKLNSSQDE